MYNLQELIEKGYIDSIKTDSTHLGDGYDIVVKLHRYSIVKVTVEVGIDETLDDAITLINDMVTSVEKMNKVKPEKSPSENLRDLLSGTEIESEEIDE